jgi:hypothetical protein
MSENYLFIRKKEEMKVPKSHQMKRKNQRKRAKSVKIEIFDESLCQK